MSQHIDKSPMHQPDVLPCPLLRPEIPSLLGLLKKSPKSVVDPPQSGVFTVIPAKAGIHFSPFTFCQGSRASARNETPSFIHPQPQMDSGLRRNDEQNQIRRSSREESAAYRSGQAPVPVQGRDLSLQQTQILLHEVFNNPLIVKLL
ncbi:MAG: hypothetical protein OXL41_03265 [Nitrospinae bacterium]|nr:hypothetical protein [Nitrospinota bacterium]